MLPIIVFIIGFMAVLYYFVRTVVLQLEAQADRDVIRAKESYESIIAQKERTEIERDRLEQETNQIFTLYDVTREMTRNFNEEEAFEVFKRKLKDNVRYEDIQLIEPDARKVRKAYSSEDLKMISLKARDRKLGYLAYKGISDEDLDTFQILVHQFALAWRRIKLYKELELLATTDSLTGVFTRRHLIERLNEEVDRAAAKKIFVSLIMMDVDHFKAINDSYGHLTGDQVLREVARTIRDNIREIDIAARYGGEEFCVILPDTDRTGALMAAERIRRAMEVKRVRAYDAELSVTLSLGLATFSKDANTSDDLIEKADWALYRAKKTGRNKVVAFELFDQ